MSRTTRATPRYAARCAKRIDLHPSRRIRAWALVWLALMCGAVLVAALPLVVRIALCVALAAVYCACLRTAVQLRGRRAVKALGWSEDGDLLAWCGSAVGPSAAELAPASFRVGAWLLVLTVRTDSGTHAVVLDGCVHSPAAFRRLCRTLEWPPRRRSRRVRGSS